MKLSTKMGSMAGAFLLMAGTVAFAGSHHEGHRGGARISRMLDAVNATPDQRTAILAASEDMHAQMKAARQAGKGNRELIAQLLSADRVDTAALQQALDARANQMKAVHAAILPDLVKMHDVLTPAQRQTLLAKMNARHGRQD